MKIKMFFLLFFFIVIASNLTFAQGNEHEDKNNLNDSIYAVDSEKDTELSIIANDILDRSFPKVDVLIGEDLLTNMQIGSGEPMIRFEEKIDANQKHSQHSKQKQHVEKAVHEWVSPNVKGRKVAIGITIISGLGFIGLSFFRFGEKN